ncbi:hypothetical protein Tco_1386159 [Tanacetum coccineum]
MSAIKIKKFNKRQATAKSGWEICMWHFDKKKVECFHLAQSGHFARECKFKGSKEGSRQEASRGQDFKPVRIEKEALMTLMILRHPRLYSSFKTGEYIKGVLHPLSGDYYPREQEDIDDSFYGMDCDYYEKKMAREAALKSQRMVHADIQQATPAWTNTNRVNKANKFTPRPVQLSKINPTLVTASKHIKSGRVIVITGHGNVSFCAVNFGTQIKSGSSRFNTGKQHVNSGSVHVNSGTQIKSGSSRFNTGKQMLILADVMGTWTGYRAPFEMSRTIKVGSVTFGGSKGKYPMIQGIGHRWMFDLDYLTDSMNYIPVSLQNQANPAGSKEVIDIDVQTEEAADLMVVSSTSLTGASRKAAVSEKIATKKPSSTPISKSADDIMTFRKELDALALKHLGPVHATAPTSTNPVNTGSGNLNTGFEEVTPGNIEAISPSADHEEEVFSDADDDEMHEIRIYDKSSEGIFEKASYDDDGIITDFNNLPDEVDVSTNHTLRIHTAHPQSQILGDPNTPVQTRSSLKKITEAHALVSYIQDWQEAII